MDRVTGGLFQPAQPLSNPKIYTFLDKNKGTTDKQSGVFAMEIPETLASPAEAAGYSEKFWTNFTVAPYSHYDTSYFFVGGADTITVTVFTGSQLISNARIRMYFGTPGAPFSFATQQTVSGSDSNYSDGTTVTFSVHGSYGKVRLYNDSSSTLQVTQVTAYWVTP
ncbi:MAG: hypothetical protein HY314_05580 [Acidobacteria bacterium]|nr:hypothetical protein [Acidobacteriota bacterium]